MTKQTDPKSFSGAVARVIDGIGVEEAAAAVGRSERTIYLWADPDHDGGPSLAQALTLDVAFSRAGKGKAPIFQVYARKLADLATDAPTLVGPVLNEFLDVISVEGRLSEILKTMFDPLSPGGATVTPSEQLSALELVEALRRELDDVEVSIRAEGGGST